MMKTSIKKTEEPPPNSDLDAWRHLTAAGGLHRLRHEDIVAAIQHIGPKGDQKLLNTLMGHISDQILRILRRSVSTKHKNEGNDIIERAHGQLIVAVLKPMSADGQGLRIAFNARVRFRADDAIVAEIREAERYTSYETDADGGMVEPPADAPSDYAEQVSYVEHLLSKIPDPRKCLAFRLHMDGCPIAPGKGKESIARTLGVSAKTAGEWIAEVQALLKNLGVTNG